MLDRKAHQGGNPSPTFTPTCTLRNSKNGSRDLGEAQPLTLSIAMSLQSDFAVSSARHLRV